MQIEMLGNVFYLFGVVIGFGHVADVPNTEPSIPVTVVGAVKPAAVREGDEIPLEINIQNALKREIAHATFRLTPVEWHGETTNISLVDIYRDGVKRQLYLARPKVEVPRTISGMGGHRISPGKSLAIRTDARKWTIDGGWKPGKYEVNAVAVVTVGRPNR